MLSRNLDTWLQKDVISNTAAWLVHAPQVAGAVVDVAEKNTDILVVRLLQEICFSRLFSVIRLPSEVAENKVGQM